MSDSLKSWNPEAAGKAAGLAERGGGSSDGITERRPLGWRPTSGSLARSHDGMRKYNRDRALDKKLDAALGPVKAKRIPEGSRFCKCGCGGPVTPRALYTPECKARAKRERRKVATSLPGRMSATPKRMSGEAMRAPVKKCPVCADLSERRDPGGCSGCGLPWAAERIAR